MSSGFGAGSSVCPTNEIAILTAIVEKLRADMDDIIPNETTCFISDVPWPDVTVHDDTFCTVCLRDGGYGEQEPTGGGSFGIIENAIFQVTFWSKLSTDQIEHSIYAMTDATRGILKLKQRVLKCLAGQQMFDGTTPLLASGCLRPVSSMHPPSRQGDADYTSFSLAFAGSFYWDLVS